MNVKIVAILSIVLSSVSFHSHALLTDPAEPWTTTWYPYTLDGVPVRDPEGGKQNDATNGGASFTGPSEIASGYTDTEFPCNPAEFNDNGTPTPVGTQCGEKNSAFYFYENGGTVGDISDDFLFLRIRVNSDPQAANGLGFVPNHWNFLLDIEEPAGGGNPVGELDGIKEFWIDLDGNGLSGNSGGIDKLRLVYDNGPDNTAPNEDGAGTGTFPDNICDVTGSNSTTDGTGVVINSYIACHSEGLTGTACYNGTDDLSHARIVAVVDEDPTDLTGEYFIDVQVPVSDLTDNSGCYTNPANLTDPEEIAQGLQLVTDTEQFAIGYSTSDSAQDPLQKDFIFIDGLGDEITTPVTIAFLQASNKGNLLTVDWSTATETSNIGFNIYAIINDEWIKLNSEIIPGALDSLEPLDYQAQLANPYGRSLDGVGIAGMDVNGDEDRHGPFAMNRVNGSRPVFSPVNWGQIRRSMKASMDTRASSKIKINQQGPSEVAHLAVPADGLYRVTHQQLKSAGLDLEGTNLNEIAVSFKGVPVARYIGGATEIGRWGAQNWIEFIGNAPVGRDAVYLDANKYQLSSDRSLVKLADAFEIPATNKKVFETNRWYGFSIPGDDPWYDASLFALGATRPATLTRRFDLPGLQPGEAKMTLSLSALMEGQHHMTVHLKVDGSQKLVAEVTTDGWSAWPVDIKVSTDWLKETGNELVMTLSGDANGYRFVTYDKLVVEYPNNLQGTAATPDITLASNISPEQLSSGLAELLIISHPSLIGPALDEYISLRESEGWKIKLVDVDDIYEAYGYGMALPSSITDFLTDARATGFSHVQIVGASNYDYHDYLGLNSISFIPSIYVNTNNIIEYTPCDTCYVLDEGELPYAAIGRWPVRSEAELQAVVNKTRTWKSSGQSSAKTALLIADQNEESSNYINNVELAAEAMFDQGWTDIETVYLDDELALAQGDKNLAVSNARYEIDKYLENGASLTLFSGHGAPDRWSFAGMLRQQDIASINNSATPTLALPLTCYTTYAESPRTASLAYQLISAGDHGAVAVYGPATLSEDSENTAIAKEVISGLLSNQTIGSAVMSAKRKLGAPFRDVILNSNILGDVTLKH